MALNWSITDIENYEELKVYGTDDPGTGQFIPDPDGESWVLRADVECLMWLSITCGYSKITKNNVNEVFTRIAMVEAVTGAYRSEVIDVPTPEIVKNIYDLIDVLVEKGNADINDWGNAAVTALATLKDSIDILVPKQDRVPRYFTLAEVERCIGLSTNATPKTNAQFDKDIAKLLRQSVQP